MTVHRKRFLVNKTNRRTEFQFYWYYDSTCFGQPFCPSSGVLSRTLAFGTFYTVVMTFCYQEQDGTAMRFHSTIFAMKNNNYYIFRVYVCRFRDLPCKVHVPHCNLWPARLYNICPHYLIKA